MKNIGTFVMMIGVLAVSLPAHSEWNQTLKQYDCLEVEKFAVDRNDDSSRKTERAADISDEVLSGLQQKIVGEVTDAKIFPKVTKAEESSCSGKTLIYGGNLTDYKKGNRAVRILVNYGAGKEKFEVESYLKDKSSGQIVAHERIVDREFQDSGGNDKAQRNFAKKVLNFIKKGN